MTETSPDILARAAWQPSAFHPSSAGVAAQAGSRSGVVAVVRDVADVAREWAELRTQAAGVTYFQSVEWCSTWIAACQAAGCAEDVRIVTVREAGRLVLLWPLAVRRKGPVAILHALAEPATQYCDLLVAPSPHASAWFDGAWQAVLAQRDVDLIRLRKVRADAALARFGQRWLGNRAVAADAAPFMRLAADDGTARPRRSGRSLNALKRHLKRLKEHGPVVFETVPVEHHVSALRDALRLKRDWSHDRGLASAGYSHPGNTGAMRALARQGLFTIRRVRVGNETAAVEIGIVDRGHYLSMIQSYDARYARHAPGRLLLWQTFDDRGTGIRTFDFLAPSGPHKTEWADDAVTVTDYAIARSLKGRLYLELSKRLKPRLKALHRRMRKLARFRFADAARAGFGRIAGPRDPAPGGADAPGDGTGS